ncbi:MAG: hypothetical protein E4H01_06975 [Lysobacterales bacterium]|nr:MAG: hypothetical protein E4H01_06975 [Xanthomonadales bacterium]
MIRTSPIPISFLTTKYKFVLGRRVTGLLQEPFDREALQKRVLRKDREKKNAEMAYYIDTRALSLRLDQVVGATNWETRIVEVKDCVDRIVVVAALTIGGTSREAEGEELKQTEDYKTNAMKSQELVFMKAGPQARKRAAVEFGIGDYLYGFSDVNTWEPLNDKGFPKDSIIDMSKLPEWARPTPGPVLVVREAAYLLNIKLPVDLKQVSAEDTAKIQALLNDEFGVKTLSSGFSREDYLELASVIARCSDYLDVNGGTLEGMKAEYAGTTYQLTVTDRVAVTDDVS